MNWKEEVEKRRQALEEKRETAGAVRRRQVQEEFARLDDIVKPMLEDMNRVLLDGKGGVFTDHRVNCDIKGGLCDLRYTAQLEWDHDRWQSAKRVRVWLDVTREPEEEESYVVLRVNRTPVTQPIQFSELMRLPYLIDCPRLLDSLPGAFVEPEYADRSPDSDK